MDLLDSWAGLNAPTRGVPMAPRHLPDVVLARDLERPTAAGQPDRSDLRRLRRGVLAPLPDVHASPSARAVHEVLLHARAFQLTWRAPFAFSRTTAALLLGCWVLGPSLPVHVTQAVRPGGRAQGETLVRRHVQHVPARDLRVHDDVVVTSLEQTIVECAAELPLVKAVVLADSGLRLGADRRAIEQLLSALDGTRGVRRAREALDLATDRVHSPGESIVRAVAASVGLPQPTTLHPADTDLGLLELDVAWPEMRVAVEMDGAVKFAGLTGAALVQRLHEQMARHDALVRAGWVVLRLDWAALRDEPALARRLTRLVLHRLV